MATAVDVMKYIKSRQHVWGETQVHKLVYLSQSWSLAWDGQPLVAEKIEAWENGPVVRALRFRKDPADPNALTVDERLVVDAILAEYGHLNGSQLSDLTHQQAPWADVWNTRGDRDWCDDEITHDAMRRYFTSEAIRGEGPQKPSIWKGAPRDDDEISAIAAASAERWADALVLLSR